MTSRAAPERDADRAALRELLCADGIFRSTPEHPIVSHDGSSIAWMLDSQRISLTAPGAALAARCLLDQLEGFESTQIATYGVTAIPLLQACVMASGGRHTGLVIRKARKGYGSMKLIEGPLDRDRPVVMLDDSIASGSSIFRGLEILEAAGLRVEGAVVLVRFGWYGGYARLIERGLHVASVFDVHTDLVPIVEPTRPRPAFNPSLALPAVRWADDAAPDGLHPAALARLVMTRHLAGEPVPRPPARLDDDHDSAGGAWVSVRSRANVHLRHGRDGQWIFPGEPRPTPGEAVVRAALRTATRLPSPRVLDDSAIAVTFFGALETCTVGDLDNDRYGIVVRSAERVERLGGALPRMPGMTRTWAQFEHARTRNAKLLSFEPYVLYRHTVAKAVEPGEAWQPTGVPRDDGDAWYRDPARAGRIAARAHALTRAALTGEPAAGGPLPDDVIGPCDGLYVTVYLGGKVVGCMGTKIVSLDDDLRRLAGRAVDDPRFARGRREPGAPLAVTVSVLTDAAPMGAQAPADVAPMIRQGEQALMVFQGARMGLLLPFVILQQSLTPTQFVAEVIDKAGITRPPYAWVRYDAHTWFADDAGPRMVRWGLPPGTPPASLAEGVARLTPLMLGYLRQHQRADGLRDGVYRPFLDRVLGELERPRQIHGAWILARAHRVLGDDELGARARASVDAVTAAVAATPAQNPGMAIIERACLLLARVEAGDGAPDPVAVELAAALVAAIDVHGRVVIDDAAAAADAPTAATATDDSGGGDDGNADGDADGDDDDDDDDGAAAPARATPAPGATATDSAEARRDRELQRRRRDAFGDYAPAQVVLALATAAHRGVIDVDPAIVTRALRACRERFRYKRGWGQVSWLPQAAAAWATLIGSDDAAAEATAIATEVIDWALDHQEAGSGGFLNGEQADSPGCSTGVYLEGVAAALDLVVARGDQARAVRYRAAALAAVRFLDVLTYQDRDRPLLPAPARALGGVRISRTAGDVRIDFVQHALQALLLLRAHVATTA